MTTNAINLNNVTVTYDHFKLDSLTFSIPKGEIIGFVGENGAGKTTTIKAILNLLRLDDGNITLLGLDSHKSASQIKEKVGVVLDDTFFHEDFKIKEIEKIMRHLYQNWDQTYFYDLLKKHTIDPEKTFKQCSKGMQSKVRIFLALAHHPTILLLDEPTTGLDPVSRNDILDIFREFMNDEKAILFSSHITSDLDKIADQIILIHQGKIKLIENQISLDENYGILKISLDDFKELTDVTFLTVLKKEHSIECLTNEKQKIRQEYPDFEIITPNIEEILLMFKKGVQP
ncbi:ABC transporter ATP-binding protein [Vagococcus sp.]|uniref:ABC transporter ATP-binding protein n=1 Tax=Vagococcus sp. TaxID=1933889 RepID=UPI003F96E04F